MAVKVSPKLYVNWGLLLIVKACSLASSLRFSFHYFAFPRAQNSSNNSVYQANLIT